MRKDPDGAPAPVTRSRAWERSIDVELITRLFGGGARAREVDDICWLRPAAAKAAVRAWWRAANMHHFSSIDDMRKEEKRLFGAPGRYDAHGNPIDGPGALELTVSADSVEALAHAYDEPQHSALNVAYFPAMGLGQDKAKLVHPSNRATAKVSISTSRPELAQADRDAIEQGVRLWLTLGGAGARTRRGAGALAVTDRETAATLQLPDSRDALVAFLREQCRRRTVEPALDGIFGLARTRSIFVGKEQQSTGEEAQRQLLEALRAARQDRPPPSRWQGQHGWGQSRWPEADAIRLRVTTRTRQTFRHRPDEGNAGRYPRAALGLPIVVHYKFHREPDDHHVLAVIPRGEEWSKLDRYASPILLRPVRVWNETGPSYIPVAIFFDCLLPHTARPLVTMSPEEEPAPDDVVEDFEIRAHADETLDRVANAFGSTKFERFDMTGPDRS